MFDAPPLPETPLPQPVSATVPANVNKAISTNLSTAFRRRFSASTIIPSGPSNASIMPLFLLSIGPGWTWLIVDATLIVAVAGTGNVPVIATLIGLTEHVTYFTTVEHPIATEPVNPPPAANVSVSIPEVPCITFIVVVELDIVTAATTVNVAAGLVEFAYWPPVPDV